MAPAAVRRPAATVAAPPVASGPNFLDLSFYSGGFTLPPGRYAMLHDIVLHSFTDKNQQTQGPPRLGVMLTAYPLDGGDPIQQFISMGTKAHLSFMPNESGKGLVAVPGGPGTVTNKANWFYYLESFMNCSGVAGGNDISVIDGVWVVTDQIPEPEERKGFASTSEVEQASSGPKKMVVVVEIIDGGKPWEGGGGFPEAGKALGPAAGANPVSTRPAVARPPAARVATAAAPVASTPAAVDGDATYAAAVNGIASVLTKAQNAKGCPKLMLKTGTFKAVTDAEGGTVAQTVIDTYFGADETVLSNILDELGFALNGVRVDLKA